MVGQAFTSFTRGTCNVPGKYGQYYSYWNHGSGMCQLAVWWPSQSYTKAKVAIFVDGTEYGYVRGWSNMTAIFTDAKMLALATAMSAAGWVIIAANYPGGSKNEHTVLNTLLSGPTPGAFRIAGSWGEIHPVSLWPEHPYHLARAVQHVKDNFDAASTPFGEKLLGRGNSIDPSKVVLVGRKHGASIAMTMALQPTATYSFDRTLAPESQDMYFPRTSHRVAAVVSVDPMIDFSQFYIAKDFASQSPAPLFFQGDKWATFTRAEDFGPWSNVEIARKKICPWWSLQTKDTENANIGFYTEFTGSGYGNVSYDANLVASDWSPGVVGTVAGKLWIDPTDDFQAPNWAAGILSAYRTGPILNSVTNYGATLTSNGAYAGAVMSWLGGYGL